MSPSARGRAIAERAPEAIKGTEAAILGLLCEGPRTGYAIKRDVEQRLGHFWSESYGHVYPMLERLHAGGLTARSVERQSGRPDRKVHTITEQGRAALAAWFEDPPSPQRPRNELLLRVFLGRHAEPDLLLRDVRSNRAWAASALAELEELTDRLDAEAADEPDIHYWKLTLAYGLGVLRAHVAWARLAEEQLAEEVASE